MNSRRLPELLAPAGSPEALDAAIKGGADAIYVGGHLLNARMNARNFTEEQLSESVKKCHRNGVKLYVTLNTAVLDRELLSAVEYADGLYKMGVDALIVADLGLAFALKGRYDDMGIHASTQASGHNAECARELQALGFDRMVCARELSGKDIKKLCEESPIEIEQFIHGAMCVSQSGQCLASAMMGGRSGNRGVCAQPCRMCYNGAYPLSLKDMCLALHIPELIESGVCSLKIEGRMKSPAYVYEVTRTYRRLLDEGRNATEDELNTLSEIFSRSGFTDGYYVGEINGEMNGVRRESDISATRSVKTEFKSVKRDIPRITVRERSVTETFVPPKAAKREKKSGKPINTARFLFPEQIVGEGYFSHIYLPLERFERCGADGVVLPPSVFPTKEAELERLLERAVSKGATHALVCNIGQIKTAEKYGLILHGDIRLNVFNTLNAKILTELGLRDVMLSPELTLPQMRDIAAPKCAVVYGRIPIMTLTKPIDLKGQPVSVLRDKTGATFQIVKEFGYDILLNSVPFYMADKQSKLDENGIRGRHFNFTTESRREAAEVIEHYKNGVPSTGNIRRIAY